MRGKREGSRGAGASSRGRARQVSGWRALPHHTCAPVTIFHHMSTCHYVYPPIDLSTLHMHSCPDCEAANMSQFGTNLSRLGHHSAAGAPGGDTVSPCSHSTSYVSLQEDCVSNVGHIRESKCPISQQRDRESSVSWGTGFQTERACPQTAQASTLPHHHRSSVQ